MRTSAGFLPHEARCRSVIVHAVHGHPGRGGAAVAGAVGIGAALGYVTWAVIDTAAFSHETKASGPIVSIVPSVGASGASLSLTGTF